MTVASLALRLGSDVCSSDDALVLAEGEVVSRGPARTVVAESPAFAPQVTKVLGPPWLRVDEVTDALETA